MTAALEGVSGQQHAPAALYPRERPGTHFTGGWVGPGAGLDGRKISSPPGFDTGPSARSQSLYRLSYRVHFEMSYILELTGYRRRGCCRSVVNEAAVIRAPFATCA